MEKLHVNEDLIYRVDGKIKDVSYKKNIKKFIIFKDSDEAKKIDEEYGFEYDDSNLVLGVFSYNEEKGNSIFKIATAHTDENNKIILHDFYNNPSNKDNSNFYIGLNDASDFDFMFFNNDELINKLVNVDELLPPILDIIDYIKNPIDDEDIFKVIAVLDDLEYDDELKCEVRIISVDEFGDEFIGIILEDFENSLNLKKGDYVHIMEICNELNIFIDKYEDSLKIQNTLFLESNIYNEFDKNKEFLENLYNQNKDNENYFNEMLVIYSEIVRSEDVGLVTEILLNRFNPIKDKMDEFLELSDEKKALSLIEEYMNNLPELYDKKNPKHHYGNPVDLNLFFLFNLFDPFSLELFEPSYCLNEVYVTYVIILAHNNMWEDALNNFKIALEINPVDFNNNIKFARFLIEYDVDQALGQIVQTAIFAYTLEHMRILYNVYKEYFEKIGDEKALKILSALTDCIDNHKRYDYSKHKKNIELAIKNNIAPTPNKAITSLINNSINNAFSSLESKYYKRLQEKIYNLNSSPIQLVNFEKLV